MKRELTCIVCPIGCQLSVTLENGVVTEVTGNTCPRGKQYAIDECTHPVRTITTTARTSNGGVIPENVSYTDDGVLRLRGNGGFYQETGLGQFPGTTYFNPEDINAINEEMDSYGVSRSHFVNNYGVNPTELMNNHYFYTNSADQATIGAIARKYGVGHDASGGWADAYIDYNEITPEVEQAFKDAYWHSTRQRDKEDIFVDPIVQAYELDATGNYNSNMKDHNKLVEQRGIELWKSPEIQKWWEETGKAWYEKGLLERRLKEEGENNSK